jgi:CheY-like chemotaxis protein
MRAVAYGLSPPPRDPSRPLGPHGGCRPGALLSLRVGAYHGACCGLQDATTGTGAGKDAMDVPHILVVKDERIIALDLTRRLRHWGYRVTRVTTRAAAVAAVDTLRPALVLLDVHLPGAMDALAAAGAIWAQQRLPIIYLTGDTPSAPFNGVQTPPPVFTLSKPFSEAALQGVLRRALAARL